MLELIRTNFENKDFQNLVIELDKELAIRDGDDHAFYHQFNQIDAIKYVIVAYLDEIPVGCGAIKALNTNTMEVKRMFVPLAHRNIGIASIVLNELEKWTCELGFERCNLETGINQGEAIRLYEKNNYIRIPNYGQYIGVENSFCFEKNLKD